jgi:hypothetical protein
MECPRCRLENPPSAPVCDCGYSFVAKALNPAAAAAALYRVAALYRLVIYAAAMQLALLALLMWLGPAIRFVGGATGAALVREMSPRCVRLALAGIGSLTLLLLLWTAQLIGELRRGPHASDAPSRWWLLPLVPMGPHLIALWFISRQTRRTFVAAGLDVGLLGPRPSDAPGRTKAG